MSVVVVHGVSVRKGSKYDWGVALRDKLIRKCLLSTLTKYNRVFATMDILNPYWGDEAARFRWKQASMPSVSLLQHLGVETETPEGDSVLNETVHELARENATEPTRFQAMGGSGNNFQAAAGRDLLQFTEALIAPVLSGEFSLSPGASPSEEAGIAADLMLAIEEAACDESVRLQASHAASPEALVALLNSAVRKRMSAQLSDPAPASKFQSMGFAERAESVLRNVKELLGRAIGAPGRAMSLSALAWKRRSLHEALSRFVGDSLVYVNERGSREQPGPIVRIVADVLREAAAGPRPLVVMTHSMGGNIVYDILTHYAPDLKVDAWISVGGQVGQFEEMKLFRASDPAVAAPEKVSTLERRVRCWINVYDPADILSFKVEPVFSGVAADIPYTTGAGVLGAHTHYFGRPSFYRALTKPLEDWLTHGERAE